MEKLYDKIQVFFIEKNTLNDYLMLFAIAYTPLVMSTFTYDHFSLPKVLFVRIAVFVSLSLLAAEIILRGRTLFFGRYDIFFLGFVLLCALTTFLSVEFITSVHGTYKRYDGLLTLFVYLYIYLFGIQIGKKFEKTQKFTFHLIVSSLIVSSYGILQFFGLDIINWEKMGFEHFRSASTLGNPNYLGGLFVISVPLAIGEYLRAEKQKSAAYAFVTLILLITLIMTLTRGAWVAAGISLIVFIVLSYREVKKQKLKYLILIAILFFSALLFLAFSDIKTHALERIQSAAKFSEGSIFTRIEIWKAALKGISEKPLFGYGPDTYKIVSQMNETLAYVKATKGRAFVDNPHNLLLQIANNSGLLATLLFLAFLIGTLGGIWRRIKNTSSLSRYLPKAILSALIGYLAHLLFTVNVFGTAVLFWFLLGLLSGSHLESKEIKLVPSNLTGLTIKATLAAAMIISTLSTFYVVKMFIGDHHLRKASVIAKEYEYDSKAAAVHYEKAIFFYPNGHYYLLAGEFYEKAAQARSQPEYIWLALEKYALAAELEPLRADHQVFLGGAYLQAQEKPNDENFRNAVKALKKAISLRPSSYQGHLLLGYAYYKNNYFQKAIPHMKKALEINPDDKKTRELLDICQRKIINKS